MPITRIWRNKNQQEISTMLHIRTHSVLGNQFPEFSVWKDTTIQSKSHSCLLTADGNFDGMKNCIFSALSSTRKRGDEVLFRKHAITSKRRLYPLTYIFGICPKTGSGQPIFSWHYISSWGDNIAVYPKTNLLTSPRKIPRSASWSILYQEGEYILWEWYDISENDDQ